VPSSTGSATTQTTTLVPRWMLSNCATNDLKVYKTVGNVLFDFDSLVIGVFKNIVADADAGNSGAVQAQMDVVNNYRCCNVLPDLDII
jgi:hypothetical protein